MEWNSCVVWYAARDFQNIFQCLVGWLDSKVLLAAEGCATPDIKITLSGNVGAASLEDQPVT